MTIKEIDVAQRYNISCKITIENVEYKGAYKVTHIIRFYKREFRKFEYSVVVSNVDNPKENYSVGLNNIRPVEGWELFIREKLKQQNSRRVFENVKNKMIL